MSDLPTQCDLTVAENVTQRLSLSGIRPKGVWLPTRHDKFDFEKYLDKIKNFEQRRTRFRISAHKLAIETGRYKGIPRHDRICTRCTDNTVEDERHFLFSCNYHTQEREALMSIINENCKNFSLLNIPVDAKLVWLLNNENIDILCALCTFLKHI